MFEAVWESFIFFGTVPCFFNHSHLLIEINEFNQLLLQDLLSSYGLLDERMLEQVQHVWSQLKVLNQTSVTWNEEKEGSGGTVVN